MDRPDLVRLEEEYYAPWAEYIENGERKFIFHNEPVYDKETAFRMQVDITAILMLSVQPSTTILKADGLCVIL